MSYEFPDKPLSGELLASRFESAKLVRVSAEARVIAVWNGSQTINLYDFELREITDSPHTAPSDEDGVPQSTEAVNGFIEDLFDEYTVN